MRDRTKEDDGTILICVLLSWHLIFFFFHLAFRLQFFVWHFSCQLLTFHSVGVVAQAPPGTASPPSPLTAAKAGSVAATLTASGGSGLAADPLRLSHSLVGRHLIHFTFPCVMVFILPDCMNSVMVLYKQLWAKHLQTALKLLSSRQQGDHGRYLNDVLRVTGAAYSISLVRYFFYLH